MTDDTASIPGGEAFDPGPENLEWVHALVIVWADEEWARIGEAAIFDVPGRTLSIGREEDSPGGHRRVRWLRQRPGENVATAALASKATSRDHLLVTARVYGLDVESVGKHPMRVDGKPVDRCRLEPGGFVEIPGQFLLRCTQRPVRMAPRRHLVEAHVGPFGEANPFGIVGETPELWNLLERLAFAARMPSHVLLRGATGTGKESAAWAIHHMGPSAGGPFVSASVGNIPRSLLEDELFGHRKGHPEARMEAKKGVIGEAHGGTLFLDEIADLPLDAQTALLRVLDKGEYRQLGGEGALTSAFKLVGAMNKELDALKLDLRKRMSTEIWMPPLASRRDDVPLILRHLLRKANSKTPDLTRHLLREQADGSVEVVPPGWFVERLMRQETYEGNVRDLLAAVNQLLEQQAPARRGVGTVQAAQDGDTGAEEARGASLTKDEVEWCLAKTGGNVTAAANEAGVSRPAFYRAMKRVGVKREEGG